MTDCAKCGISGDQALLFDAISSKGIVKICKKCSFDEHLPIIKKGSEPSPEKTVGVYERLSKMSGVERERAPPRQKSDVLRRQESELRKVVDERFTSHISKSAKKREDLIENFHWVLMRVRRFRKLTQEQVAAAISEPERAVKMAEQGILPEGQTLVKKLENYLGVRITKPDFYEKREEPKRLTFDSNTFKKLTIDDLREMKKKKEVQESEKSKASDHDSFEQGVESDEDFGK